jgi:hypothetical protein
MLVLARRGVIQQDKHRRLEIAFEAPALEDSTEDDINDWLPPTNAIAAEGDISGACCAGPFEMVEDSELKRPARRIGSKRAFAPLM